MWIASTHGFISIIQHRNLRDTLLVKARTVNDLKTLFDSNRILKTGDADYLYMVLVNKQELANILVKMIKNIDYFDFKNEISDTLEHWGNDQDL